MQDVMLLLLFFFSIYGVMGMQLFGESSAFAVRVGVSSQPWL